MTTLSMVTKGAKNVQKALDQRQALIERRHSEATRAAAVVFQKALRKTVPRKKGKLRQHVKLFDAGGGNWKVKLTGHVAHLVTGDTKEHAIQPLGMEAAQKHQLTRGRRMQGPKLAKHALFFKGAQHPFARAIHPAHHGDPTIVPRARALGASEARAAAFAVLRGEHVTG